MIRRISVVFFATIVLIFFFNEKTHAQNGQVFAAVKKDGFWGFIDTMGRVQIPFTLEATQGFSEGLALVKYSGNWGFINKKGDFKLQPHFTEANLFHDGHALIAFFDPTDKTSYRGYINKFGNLITVLEDWETGSDFHDNLVKIKSIDVNGPAIGYKDTMDTWIIKPHYDQGTDFNEGRAAVSLGRYWGFIDEKNNQFIFPQYNDAWAFSEGLAYIKNEKGTSFVDTSGKVIFTCNYEETDVLVQEGMIGFRDKGKIGFMNRKGHVLIKPAFSGTNLSRFHEGVAPIMGDNGKYGYIDKKGEFVIAPQFEHAASFENNYASVKSNGKYGFIDKKGNWIIQPIYDDAYDFQNTDFY